MLSREICKHCFKMSAVGFTVPDEVWREATEDFEHVLCLTCFTHFADLKRVRWDKDIQFWPVSLVTYEED